MKSYIEQIYNEGFATTFYLKPVNYLKKKIKNKKIANFLIRIIKAINTLLVLSFAIYVLYKKLF